MTAREDPGEREFRYGTRAAIESRRQALRIIRKLIVLADDGGVDAYNSRCAAVRPALEGISAMMLRRTGRAPALLFPARSARAAWLAAVAISIASGCGREPSPPPRPAPEVSVLTVEPKSIPY